ncbi:type I-E CRISPR-associated protein Cas6/Cse3/CasE [Actinomadura sp. ATCC 31491]|uniref:Type I-E CRISPR-associated protein Cas6/Cse3/CasE n=1 Tax=Actinomadura luzonensis TaxID=2805427 RepID=A0ABT0FR56_9ACTN|nr:type I-E CRISPR-associated protein Cas6/Cse3/CasE [Actinomadura luzonensis]MCK2214769.1 type I-E CRISPR-associated protein Cas6/Cse3/CasE [Actinomadura luzonensis]
MTAWLMRILPDLTRRDVNNDLRDPDRLHKRLMLLVPDDIGDRARATAGVLFRVEETRQGTQLLVQSSMKPELERLPDGYGEISVRELGTLLGNLRAGLRVQYRIAANPSKRLGKSAGENAGKIQALRGPDAEEWWGAKAAGHGLAVATVQALSERDIRAKGSVRHAVVRFDGSGVVTDPDALRAAVLSGIGRGKSYGCGLLSLAVAR